MCNFGKLVEGNLHWTIWDPHSVNSRRICCFDVETECFSSFSAPLGGGDVDLSVLRDCLCACRIAWDWDEDGEVIEIWLMKEYGVEESWRKEYVMIQNPDFGRDDQLPPFYYPIKVFKDGDILMLWEEKLLIYYSNNTKTTQQICVLAFAGDNHNYIYAMIFTPSLFSLKNLGMENVISFN
ncbi:F-box protein At3g07870-like [Salvia miltiorrhiza]|uniref:F-box protein At3g07870-like n=1 Tax=Salvia miltiorrhiza TaxID=226208 RepID=UPI0025AD22CF|nr:F-box protein At3g07870-like [Salvia miltiorrhiza]